jgi:hypothetical protein
MAPGTRENRLLVSYSIRAPVACQRGRSSRLWARQERRRQSWITGSGHTLPAPSRHTWATARAPATLRLRQGAPPRMSCTATWLNSTADPSRHRPASRSPAGLLPRLRPSRRHCPSYQPHLGVRISPSPCPPTSCRCRRDRRLPAARPSPRPATLSLIPPRLRPP